MIATAVWAAGAAVLVSPLLAGWTVSLADSRRAWWRPGPVSGSRWVTVTAAAVLLAGLAAAGDPVLAWWLLAAGGTVLAVVDAQTHRLPARFVYPLAGAIAAAVVAAAMAGAGSPAALIRAAAAAAAVGGALLVIRFVSPAAVGLGDVRVAALAAGLLGYTGWPQVWQGQLLTVLLAGVSVLAVRAAPATTPSGDAPLGPAIIAAAMLTGWL